MACEGSAGVEKTFNILRLPRSIQTQSVKVPPVSMATRRGWERRGMVVIRRIRVTFAAMRYAFLVETYATERVKVVSVWSEFRNEDLAVRPREGDPRGRSVHEQMVHQCVSEDLWFRNMLGIDVGAPPLPKQEMRLEFMKRYAEDSSKRLAALQEKDEAWWEENVKFFDVQRSRAWVMTRRMTHTSHHRGQLMAMLRMLGRDVHSNYGPTADTGGLMQNHAPTIYAYASLEALLVGENAGGAKAALPGSGGKAVTERPA
jgi:uncharacterized damage-inducible protein DinB